MVTGENLSVERACELGLVNQLLDADGFAARALEYAKQFTPPGKAAFAVGRIKRAVQTGAEVDLASGLALERELQQQLFQSADAKEGIAAFVERRKPGFQGR